MSTFLWVCLIIVWILAILAAFAIGIGEIDDGNAPVGLGVLAVAVVLLAGLITLGDQMGAFDDPPCGTGTHSETRPTGYTTPVLVGKVTVMEPQYDTKCYPDVVPQGVAEPGQF